MADPADGVEVIGPMDTTRPLAEILSDMRTARDNYQAGHFGTNEYVDQVLALDEQMTFRLARSFNRDSGFDMALSGNQLSSEFRADLPDEIRSRLPSADLEENFLENFERGSSDPDLMRLQGIEAMKVLKVSLQRILEDHPQLDAVSPEDARAVGQRRMSGAEFEEKYPDIDPDLVGVAVLARIMADDNLSLADTKQIHTNALEFIGNTLMVRLEESDEFTAWENQKREQIIAAIRSNEPLMHDIANLHPLLDSVSENDFRQQHELRSGIMDQLTGIYAQVYKLPDLTPDQVGQFYSPLDKLLDDKGMLAYAIGTPGITGEDAVVVKTQLFTELFSTNMNETDNAVTAHFLTTAFEELRHTVDLRYTDHLANEEMDADHPAFDHTTNIAMNRWFLTQDQGFYDKQYMERTAKASAAMLTNNLIADIPAPALAVTPDVNEHRDPQDTIATNVQPN